MIADRRNDAMRAVFDALRAGDTETAKRLALAAFKLGCEHPILLNLRALDHEAHGRFQDALSDLRRAHILAPNDFSILNACGLCLARMQQFEEALACATTRPSRFGLTSGLLGSTPAGLWSNWASAPRPLKPI